MKRINGINYPETEEELRRWERGWADMMIKIWTEHILRLGIVDTGNLMRSLTGQVIDATSQTTIVHQFLLYGIYVARGVGQGFTRGNPADLQIMNKVYRDEHDLNKPRKRGPKWGGGYTSGKPRQKRDWFARKYLRSLYVLAETERNVYGEMFMGNLSNVVQAIFNGKEIVGSSGTDVTATVNRT